MQCVPLMRRLFDNAFSFAPRQALFPKIEKHCAEYGPVKGNTEIAAQSSIALELGN